MKKIAVIGTGRMGGAFATAFAKRTSHTVSIRGSHADSSSVAAFSHQLGVQVADDKERLAADIVFVATPPAALDDAAAALKGFAGIIVSAMVPGAGGYELKRDDGTSAAEQLARLVPTGRVVTAFLPPPCPKSNSTEPSPWGTFAPDRLTGRAHQARQNSSRGFDGENFGGGEMRAITP
jgi:predicted dinucleotide-binding enzyme